MEKEIRVMAVIPHQDDFEYCAGGTFALLRKRFKEKLKIKILALSRGASGHHLAGVEETFRRREKEAQKSASLIDADYECMTCLDGGHLPAQVFIDRNILGGLWNAVRNFEPDYLFCPPLPADPLHGVHIDHYHTALAVRLTAYQYKVPHAYPSINSRVKRKLICPVIINLDDLYIMADNYHVSVDISSGYEKKTQMLLCHKSQMFEWLPWTEGVTGDISEAELLTSLKNKHSIINKSHNINDEIPREYFCITQWGRIASAEDISKIFPFGEIRENIIPNCNPSINDKGNF